MNRVQYSAYSLNPFAYSPSCLAREAVGASSPLSEGGG
jgi:hypothetical protein